ncbi:MAG TPA: hypothetical protein VGZ22_17745 [Isosphaeraceae bacterium]|jgi:hypothetical protein|nr:hypothetical protein [Isosphaeraceae bacterium]
MAEAKADNTYRLVVFNPPDDPPAVRDLLVGVTGIHPTDAMRWVARTPGIWPQPLAEGEVRELLDGLFDLGVPAEAWRIDLLPDLSPPRTIHDGACLPDGFRVKGLRGEPTHWVPWDKIELISAGRITLEDEYRDVTPRGWASALATGFSAMIGRAPRFTRRARAMRIPRDPVGELLIVRKDPRLAFRVVENQMKYAYLGDRLRLSASENFPLLLADLCARAESAYITPSTRALLEHGNAPDYEFPSSLALLEYTTHRLLWSWYRRDRDSQMKTDQ